MKLVILVAALAVQAGPTAPPRSETSQAQRPSMTLPSFPLAERSAMPNGLKSGAGCRSIYQQVQDEARRNRDDEHRTLDREPPASLLLAVDRQVEGCREPTFIRRDVAPGARPLGQPSR